MTTTLTIKTPRAMYYYTPEEARQIYKELHAIFQGQTEAPPLPQLTPILPPVVEKKPGPTDVYPFPDSTDHRPKFRPSISGPAIGGWPNPISPFNPHPWHNPTDVMKGGITQQGSVFIRSAQGVPV